MTARSRKTSRLLTGPLLLEDRLAPAVFNATDPAILGSNAAAVAELVGFFTTANTNADATDTINLFPGTTYVFNTAVDRFDGGTALPVIDNINNAITVNGNGATFLRPAGAESFRFLRAIGQVDPTVILPGSPAVGPTLTLNNLTLRGGNTYDYSMPNRTDQAFPVLDGGAVRLDNADLVTNGVSFINNTATDNGGAVGFDGRLQYASRTRFNSTTFDGNYAGKAGGAVSVLQPDAGATIFNVITFTDSTLNANISLTGAGAAAGEPVEFDLLRTKVTNNRGNVGGVSGSLVTATDTLFSGNVSTGTGAAAVVATGNMLTLINSTVTKNTSGAAGAVVGQAVGRAVELLNSTVHDNTGGSAAIEAPVGEVVLSFATVTNNRATSGATAGVMVDANILDVYASVIAGNRVTDPLSPTVDIGAKQVRNNGFNLIGVAPASYPRFPGDLVGTVGSELDPKLSVLGNYGGLTQTRLPAAGSPLINAAGVPLASRITTDQRGLTRVVGGAADIGATELQAGDPSLPAEAPLPPLVPLPPPPPSPPTPPPGQGNVIAVGPGGPASANGSTGPLVNSVTAGTAGGTNIAQLIAPDGTVKLSVIPFSVNVPGGVRVAAADVTGDGVADLITATGAGVPDSVAVFDGSNGKLVTRFSPFPDFTGGLFVTAGDVTGDGLADLIVSPDVGGGPRITVFRGGDFAVAANFFGIDDPNFRGGARVAVGDLNGDNVNDLVVAAGAGGGPRVALFDGTSLSGGAFTKKLVNDFFVFDQSLRDGVYVAAGDVDADGFDDLVVGAGPGGGPRVLVLSGRQLAQSGQLVPINDFFAGDVNRRDGVPVAVRDLDGNGLADVIAGGGATGRVTAFRGDKLITGGTPSPDVDLTPFPGFNGGVNVG